MELETVAEMMVGAMAARVAELVVMEGVRAGVVMERRIQRRLHGTSWSCNWP